MRKLNLRGIMVRGGVALAIWAGMSSCQMLGGSGGSSAKAKPQWTVYDEAYRKMKPGKGSIRIDLNQQVARMFNQDGELALETDIASGVPASPTPIGKFKILEKLDVKCSNLYGEYVDEKTGKSVSDSWTEQAAPAGTKFRGREMPYWLRITWDGVGMHVGSFEPRKPNSFGCIRVPRDVQPKIFAKSDVGMPVEIENPYPRMLAPREEDKLEIFKPRVR